MIIGCILNLRYPVVLEIKYCYASCFILQVILHNESLFFPSFLILWFRFKVIMLQVGPVIIASIPHCRHRLHAILT